MKSLFATRQAAENPAVNMRDRHREFEVIESVTRALREANSSHEIAQHLMLETVRLMRSQHAAVFVLEGTDTLEMRAAHGLFEALQPFPVLRGQGLAWACVETRDVVYSVDALRDEKHIRESHDGAPSHAQLSVPILNSAGVPLGVLVSGRNHPDTYDAFDTRLICVIADAAASALERIRISERLMTQVRESRTLLELSRMLERTDQNAVTAGLERVRQLAGANVGVIARLDDAGIQLCAQVGKSQHVFQNALVQGSVFEVLSKLDFLYGQGFELLESSHETSAVMTLARLGVKATYGVVLDTEDAPIMIVLFKFDAAHGWTATEQHLLEGATRMLGAVISRTERVQTLEMAYEGALRAIGVALEARDREPAGHTDRVSKMSEQLAVLIGFDPTQARAVRWGAYIHDVGKLSVPDEVLFKPGRLNPEEMELAKSHARLGYELALNLHFLPEVSRAVVLYHHERWDGTGYPEGLKGEMIPLEARIVSVCDVFDTLIFVRSYKPAMTIPEARLELRNAAKIGQLEPRLVWAFEQLLNSLHMSS